MSLTLPEFKDRVAAKLNPDDLLELLNISSEELVAAFEDKLLEKADELTELLAEDEEYGASTEED